MHWKYTNLRSIQVEITDYQPKDKPISVITEHIWIDAHQEKVYAILEDLSKFVLFNFLFNLLRT